MLSDYINKKLLEMQEGEKSGSATQQAPQAQPTQAQPPQGVGGGIIYCRKCGARNDKGSKFCTTCGASLMA